MRQARVAFFVIGIASALATLGSSVVPAQTDAYPTRVVRLVVPFAPGASTDLVTRLFGQKLSDTLGQQFIVDNRGGAGGGLGAEAVAKSEPDGYTLLVTNQGPSIFNSLLRKNPPFAVDDLAPVIQFGYSPLIIVANPKFRPSTVKEMIAEAKANPGKILIGSSGANSNVHIALEILKSATGTNITHVPYRGSGPSLQDVVAGNIHGAYTTTVSAEGLIQSGQVKVLGVAGPKRLDVIPDVPTYAEQGIQMADSALWIGLQAPARTPRAIIEKLNRELNKALQAPDVRARFAQWGLEIAGGTPEAFGAAIKTEVDRINQLIKSNALQVQ
ncbi:MAG TPA: tripartite tricarboxylate transporter substrate-binding protein [Xanthobacteraceae bacterium]|nr:tripartite tricarboxylate transporter substrate-binding protein [Xanthobacteraceae bacterium]